MKCSSCQIEAPSDAEFCPDCGLSLLVPVEVGRWTAEHITGAQFHAPKEPCHALPATAPVELADVVRHFNCAGRPT